MQYKQSLSSSFFFAASEFEIDKKGKELEGLWTFPNSEDYGNPFLNSTHPLILNGHIKEAGTLSAYQSNFIPIPQYLDYTQQWSYELNGITDTDDENYKRIIILSLVSLIIWTLPSLQLYSI